MKKINLIILLTLIGCSTQDPNTPNIVTKDDVSLCSDACAHVQPMGCPEAQPLVYPGTHCTFNAECSEGDCINGKCTETCEMLCKAFIKEGRQLGVACWQTITKCSQIESVCR